MEDEPLTNYYNRENREGSPPEDMSGWEKTWNADLAVEDLRKATDYLDKASDGLRRAGLDHYTIDCLYGLVRNEAQRLENAIR